MRISGSGIAHNGMNAIKRRRELWHAESAISALHDALLAVAKGILSPEEARDFFWHGDSFDDARFFGGVIKFEPKAPESPADERDGTERSGVRP